MPTTEERLLNKIAWTKGNKGITEGYRKERLAVLEAQLEAIKLPEAKSSEPHAPFTGDYEDALYEVCRRLACGELLSIICQTEGLPKADEIRIRALDDKPRGFAAKYQKARELGFDAMAEDVLVTTSQPPARGLDLRAFLEARRWYLSKMAPTKYGEKAQPETGPATSIPTKIVLEVVAVPPTPKGIEGVKVTNAVP